MRRIEETSQLSFLRMSLDPALAGQESDTILKNTKSLNGHTQSNVIIFPFLHG